MVLTNQSNFPPLSPDSPIPDHHRQEFSNQRSQEAGGLSVAVLNTLTLIGTLVDIASGEPDTARSLKNDFAKAITPNNLPTYTEWSKSANGLPIPDNSLAQATAEKYDKIILEIRNRPVDPSDPGYLAFIRQQVDTATELLQPPFRGSFRDYLANQEAPLT
ncbi:hypothetical protein KGQ71_02130 [Patescibacteria group bacterium]|nr:hypothetical protein [Patescibacteria group bacterium]